MSGSIRVKIEDREGTDETCGDHKFRVAVIICGFCFYCNKDGMFFGCMPKDGANKFAEQIAHELGVQVEYPEGFRQ